MQTAMLPSDRTAGAVAAQLRAMACERYEVGIRNAQSGVMILRGWGAAEVEHAIPWLRLMNAHDHDVYIRPLGSVGVILADDLTESAVAQMTQDGLAPSAVTETSPGNFQAWLRVSETPIAQELATAAARLIAERYHGDPNSADWRHFGRLAGFTNRKPEHTREGRQPYVLLREARGLLCEHGARLLQEAGERLDTVSVHHLPHRHPHPVAFEDDRSPADAYRAIAERLMARYGAPTDLSRLDWTVCRRLACSSLAVDQEYLEAAMLGASPGLHERKRGQEVKYARRTAEKVLRDPEVVAARGKLRGPELTNP
jgi:RepB DNA-primase from phage plasmid